MLNTSAFQEYAKNLIVSELKSQIGSDLGIGHLSFTPFGDVVLDSVYLNDQSNSEVLLAKHISADIDLLALLNKRVVLNSAWLTDFDVHLSKDSLNAPLNIQYIIDAFKPKNDKPNSKIEFQVNSLYFSKGRFHYEVKNQPPKPSGFDVNNLHVSELEAKIALKSLASDSLNVQVKKFSFKEKSGIEVRNLVFRLLSQGKKMNVKGFRIDLPTSYLQFNKFDVDLTQQIEGGDFLDHAKLDCIFAPSYISPKDLSVFVPAFREFDDALKLQGRIRGSLADLKAENLTIDYGRVFNLVANLEVKDLRKKDEMYILGSVDDLTLSTANIELLANNFSKNRISLPPQIKNLGTVSFQGDLSGYLKQLTAFGSLDTDLGMLKTDILFGFNPDRGIKSYVKGKLYTTNFLLGSLLNNNDFNKVSLNIEVDLKQPTNGRLFGAAKGLISNFDYKGYNYNNIDLDVNYDGSLCEGVVAIDTDHGNLKVGGTLDLSNKDLPALRVHVDASRVDLNKLRIIKDYKDSEFSFAMDANFFGSSIDNVEGILAIKSLAINRPGKEYILDNFTIEATKEESQKHLIIRSDILNGEVKGNYSFSTIAKDVQQSLEPFLPALIKSDKKFLAATKENNLTFNLQINNTDKLSDILDLPVTVFSPSKIVGFYNNINNRFKVEIFTPSLKVSGTQIKSGYIIADNLKDTINTEIDLLVLGKNNATNGLNLKSKVYNDIVDSKLLFSINSKQKINGGLSFSTKFSKDEDEPLNIEATIQKNLIHLNNSVWQLDETDIAYQNGSLKIRNFLLQNEATNQSIKINGRYSPKDPTAILKTELKDVDLEYVFQTLAIDVLRFGGLATGNVFLSSIENKPYANTKLGVKDFSFNGTPLGDLDLFSEFDDETSHVMMKGSILNKENKKTEIDGFIDPIKQSLSINFDADSLNIAFLQRFTKSVLSDISGRGTGKVRLFGNFSKVTVEGKAYIDNGNVGISFLNTNYVFSDTIYMKPNLIYFNNVSFVDENNNVAIGNGKLVHDQFEDFMYHIDMSANNFLVYNATEKHNPLFYGRVFGSGKASIGGDERALDIDVNMKTEKNSIVRMNFIQNEVDEFTFITFKNKKNIIDTISEHYTPVPIKKNSDMEINMNFYIDATPDATVELLMDPVGGDILRGSGSGAMRFAWSTKLPPRLYGNYFINRGSYNFTFQRLMERRFAIVDGSNVQFRGDPFEAILDVKTTYKVMASLNDLDKKLVQIAGQTTIPVNCVLNLAGSLKNPVVKLDLAFPTVESEVERQIKTFVNTEDMINRQVTYLLLLSKFYTPNYADIDHRSSDFAAVASATLSNQLTKIISQIDSRWELGTNIRTTDISQQGKSSTEVELLLSSRLLNDRLLINGNFGYRENRDNNAIDQSKTALMISDVDLEYLLNNSGTWRVKAYNHYNEKYYYTSDNKSTQTQGIGLLYKKDFDSFKDLLKTPKILPLNRDTTQPILPDSAQKGSPLSHFIKMKSK